MSDLPVIPNQSPVTIPAREATAYGECYIVKFVLGTADAAGCVQPLTVTFRPYHYALKRLYPDATRDVTLSIDNAWELAQKYPLAAQAIGSLVLAFALLKQLFDTEAKIAALEAEIAANPEQPELGTQLAALRTTLAELEAGLGVS